MICGLFFLFFLGVEFLRNLINKEKDLFRDFLLFSSKVFFKIRGLL